MTHCAHVVRYGAMGWLGYFPSIDGIRHARGTRVVLRTARGLETGEVLAAPGVDEPAFTDDGRILRRMTPQDELLDERLRRNRAAACRACQARLDALGVRAILADVEHLFDGSTLVLYFLGDPPANADSLLAQLSESYDAAVQFSAFAATLAHGCGPSCGTPAAAGGGCGSCAAGCSIASACGSRSAAGSSSV